MKEDKGERGRGAERGRGRAGDEREDAGVSDEVGSKGGRVPQIIYDALHVTTTSIARTWRESHVNATEYRSWGVLMKGTIAI